MLQYDSSMTRDRSAVLELLGSFTADANRPPLDYEKVCAPTEVEIVGDRLVWSPGFLRYRREPDGPARWTAETGLSERRTWTYRDASPEMLLQFIALADAPPEAIKAFAKRWGVLALCRRHWLPCCHSSGCSPTRVRGRVYVYREPLAAWRHFAMQARAIVRYAAAVRDCVPPSRVDVDDLLEHIDTLRKGQSRRPRLYELPPEERERAASSFRDYINAEISKMPEEMQKHWRQTEAWVNRELKKPYSQSAFRMGGDRNALSVHVNTWLGLGYVRPHLRWDENGPRILFSVGSLECDRLFGHLALQLLVAVSGSTGFALCSACSAPYVPRRAPARSRLHYCQRCGRRAAWRVAQRKRRRTLI